MLCNMSTPYPAHIQVPVVYTPTAELNHLQLMKLYNLEMPAIEDISWEDVSANSSAKLREYSKVYGARAKGLRMPRNRAEMNIFFTALLHARYTSTFSRSQCEDVFENGSKVHEDVRELALEKGLAFHLAQKYGLETLINVVHFMCEKDGKWTDESNAQTAALITEEFARVAERKLTEALRTSGNAGNVMSCISNCGPWEGWCGFKSGVHRE